ncbi:hypothetical protein SAMN05444141_102806 [Pseudovibrio denitrificans]|uniref:Uncharacterized protein n=1 Tax=Pseudovibrio denitrificans TaxID=258256 RepID=A0A1I7A1V1_9HYPH|nr:hypothetical protein SAMN05444141_102806 [Pseudovibrio denitrificans]
MPSAYSDISPILMAAYALSPRESRRSSVAFFRLGSSSPKNLALQIYSAPPASYLAPHMPYSE